MRCCNELENPIGIETHCPIGCFRQSLSCNELENPIGIETPAGNSVISTSPMCCNELENPIGIETDSKRLGSKGIP